MAARPSRCANGPTSVFVVAPALGPSLHDPVAAFEKADAKRRKLQNETRANGKEIKGIKTGIARALAHEGRRSLVLSDGRVMTIETSVTVE